MTDGMSGGDNAAIRQVDRMPDGSEVTAAFRLAFAADLRARFFLFACQRVNRCQATARPSRDARQRRVGDRVDRALVVRSQGVRAAVATGRCSRVTPGGLRCQRESRRGQCRINIYIASRMGWTAYYDLSQSTADRGLRGSAIVFAVADLAVTEARLAASAGSPTRKNNRILVKAAPGRVYSSPSRKTMTMKPIQKWPWAKAPAVLCFPTAPACL